MRKNAHHNNILDLRVVNNVNKVLISGFIGLTLTAGAGSTIAKGGKSAFFRADTVAETFDAETEASDEVAEITVDKILDR